MISSEDLAMQPILMFSKSSMTIETKEICNPIESVHIFWLVDDEKNGFVLSDKIENNFDSESFVTRRYRKTI